MPYIQLTIPVVLALAVFHEKIMIFKIETNPIGEKIIVLTISQSLSVPSESSAYPPGATIVAYRSSSQDYKSRCLKGMMVKRLTIVKIK